MVRGDSRRRSEAADAGRPQVHKHHVWSVAGYFIARRLAIGGLGDHFDVVEIVKDGHQSSSENGVVSHHQHSDGHGWTSGRTASTAVPPVPWGDMSRRPPTSRARSA